MAIFVGLFGLRRERSSRTGRLAGLEANISNKDLTQAVPLVIEGVVLERSSGPYAQHPNLKAILTDEEQSLVSQGLRYVDWKIEVRNVIKGHAAGTIIAQRAFDGGFAAGEGELPNPPVGELRTFWLGLSDAYTTNAHYTLIRSAP
jgi:hypothetical protein